MQGENSVLQAEQDLEAQRLQVLAELNEVDLEQQAILTGQARLDEEAAQLETAINQLAKAEAELQQRKKQVQAQAVSIGDRRTEMLARKKQADLMRVQIAQAEQAQAEQAQAEQAQAEQAQAEQAQAEQAQAEQAQAAPQEAAPQEAAPQEAAPQEAAPQEAGPQEAAPQEAGPQEAAPQVQPDAQQEPQSEAKASEADDELVNQRSSPRANVVVDVAMHSDNNFFMGLTENLSEGGLFLATYDDIPLGTELALSLNLPEHRTIQTRGVVCWVREYTQYTKDLAPGVGLRFLDLAETDQFAIREFIRRRDPILYDLG
ncbi:MAG: TIGR02266 family protein [Deltaproteobacteria bacterium]|nr:TIGR02266 family protein [Deltaproteobacteria bacterium]